MIIPVSHRSDKKMTERTGDKVVPVWDRPIEKPEEEIFLIFRKLAARGIPVALSRVELRRKIHKAQVEARKLQEEHKGARVTTFQRPLFENVITKIATGETPVTPTMK